MGTNISKTSDNKKSDNIHKEQPDIIQESPKKSDNIPKEQPDIIQESPKTSENISNEQSNITQESPKTSDISTKQTKTIQEQSTNDNKKETKKFIILYGPTGSGKSGVFNKYCEDNLKNINCDISQIENLKKNGYFVAQVDNLIEENEKYKDNISKFLEEYKDFLDKYEPNKKNNEIMEKLSTEMSAIYYNIRNKGFNQINDRNIKEHMEKGFNIIFEITGGNSDTINRICEKKGDEPDFFSLLDNYEIIVLVPFTMYKKLKVRIINRFMSSYKSKSSSRLVPINEEKLENLETTAFDNLIDLINRKCVHKIVVYSNNNSLIEFAVIEKNDSSYSCVVKNETVRNEFKENKSKTFYEFINSSC